ncbi:MAG: hypothetical protein KAR42_05260 [candidate division Zixibacteria bacterium]|nr:hypothetical protein [candidate division Zixibacteria bacterium]
MSIDKRLLVPISIEGLLVNKDGNGKPFANLTPDFDNLDADFVLGDNIAQEYFKTAPNPEPGLHLHWALPDAHTRGYQCGTLDIQAFASHLTKLHPNLSEDDVKNIIKDLQANQFVDAGFMVSRRFVPGQIIESNPEGEKEFTVGLSQKYGDYESDVISYIQNSISRGVMEYAAAPDCWHVLRIFTEYDEKTGVPKVSLRAWIVESRHAIRDSKEGAGRVTIPAKDEKDGTFYALYIGRKSDYETWMPDESVNYIDKITAVGPGDPMFGAFYPNSKTVFGFHDPYLNPTGEKEKTGVYTYLVTGWHVEPSSDPLIGDVSERLWKSCMEALKWALPDSIVDQPKGVLCHGMLYHVNWQGEDFDYESNIPKEDPEIVWGQTSIEALSTLIASKLPDEQKDAAKLLEAFQYELLSELDKPDGIQKLEEKIHTKGFSPTDGGIVYEIKLPDPDDGHTPPDTTQNFPESVGADLSELNKAQRKREDIERKIANLQWETYSTWYRYVSDRPGPKPSIGFDLCNKIVDQIGGRINTFRSQLADLGKQIHAFVDKINQEIESSPQFKGCLLTPVNGTAFYQPNDPVLLFSGEGVSRSFRHGYDHHFSKNGKLSCRSTQHTLSGINLKPREKAVQVTSEMLFKYIDKMPQGKTQVPDEIISLLAETLLLDTDQSKLIAHAAYQEACIKNPDPSEIQALAEQIEKIQTLIWNACLVNKVTSQQLADASGLIGEVPDKIGVKRHTQAWVPLSMEWSVNILRSKELKSDYSNLLDGWQLEDIDFSYCKEQMSEDFFFTQGSVILTPHAPHNLQKSLQNYIDKLDPSDPHRDELQHICEQLVHLDVLSQSLSGFNTSMLMRKETLQLPVFDFQDRDLARKVKNIIGSMNNFSPLPCQIFNPVRAGFMQLFQLWIVDAFGQIKDLGQQPPSLVSEELISKAETYKKWVTLRPRVTQPSRLNFDWISADGTKFMNSDPSTSPICGWVLPNHLDNSLMIYNSPGEAQGEIRVTTNQQSMHNIHWVPAPNTTIQPSDFDNKQLSGFVNGLLNIVEEKRFDAYHELLDNIDETLRSIDPLGFRQNQSLSVLIGRPLALVNASIGLEFSGYPAFSQSDHDLEHYLEKGFNTRGFEKLKWPVRMGDVSQICDGLLGYFDKTTDNPYKLFHAVPGSTLQPHQSDYISYDHVLQLDFSKARRQIKLVLLIDPRAGIHLTSGFQPVTYAEIPPEYVSAALNNMYVTFGINPLINQPDKVSIPLPTINKNMTWSWVEQPELKKWREIPKIIDDPSKAAFPESRYEIKEGWLKLGKREKK